MLKKISRLFLGLMVCASSACVTPTHASSAATVILTHIQAASPQGAKDEMVGIYNNTPNLIDITNWCIENKTHIKFVCFTPPDRTTVYYLPAYSYVVAATESFINSTGFYPEDIPFIYSPTNQSSGSIVNSADTVSLLNANNSVVDSYTWSTAIPAGKVVTRNLSSVPNVYETLGLFTDWSHTSLISLPLSRIEVHYVDPPAEEPEEPEENNPPISTSQAPLIVEVFPNPKGADNGAEFIEIYNPNPILPIDLSNYTLHVGQQLEKSYSFTTGTVLAPLEYRAFTNTEIKFTLLNSNSSIELRREGLVVDDTISYSNPKEGYSWSLNWRGWEYTNIPTPGIANKSSVQQEEVNDEPDDDKQPPSSVVKPCAANQYRSPETNRCRLINSSVSSTPAPCLATQYRSPETNRCRNIASSSSSVPTPCKEGQERNTETNRCRNIVKMAEAGHGVKGISIQNDEQGTRWYWWLAIGGVVALIIGYGVWEWREELQKVWVQIKTKVARIKP